VFGACAWGSYLQANSLWYQSNSPLFNANLTSYQNYILTSQSWPFYSSFYILYGCQFICHILSKLMLLSRLMQSTMHSSEALVHDEDNKTHAGVNCCSVSSIVRVASAAVVLCSVVSLASSAVSCAYEAMVSGLYIQAANACDTQGNDTNSSMYVNSITHL